ncbi:DUF4339 domain-containing protein [Bdellovibrio bacteriovorus]|uniref:DUF4339 domain-containing protein n=1 Tax=Bdellovibrio bacteriovorus TaxID=959 RepID=UPI0005A1F962|nr:DUF4339 domain-containing protein [Bdellovibrio bacteriovorus]
MRIWYAIINRQIIGPFTKDQIISLARRGDLSPSSPVSLGTKAHWKPASTWQYFPAKHFPALQEVNTELLEAISELWTILSYDGRLNAFIQTGPYSTSEVRTNLALKKVKRSDHIWKKGLSGWAKIADRPEFGISTELNIG